MRSILDIFFDFDSNPSLIPSTILIFSLHFSFISRGNRFNDDFHSMYMYTIEHLTPTELVRDPQSNKTQCFSVDKV